MSVNNPAEKNALIVSKGYNIDLSKHLSRAIDNTSVKKADLIFGMEYSDYKEIIKRYPSYRNKISLLPVFNGKSFTGRRSLIIRDPYGLGLEEFQKCFKHIHNCVFNCLSCLKC